MKLLGHNSDADAPHERGAVEAEANPCAGQKEAKRTKRRVSGKTAADQFPPSPLMGIKGAAAYLRMSVFMLRQRAGREIPYVQYGGGTSPFLFLHSDLDKFIQEHRNDFSS